MRAAASTLVMTGEAERAHRLLREVVESQARTRQVRELERRLALDPGDRAAAIELRGVQASHRQSHQGNAADDGAPDASAVYLRHCAACHGANGNGDGPASRHLYPRPRDLRHDRFRLVSTVNAMPSRADVERVIQQGIPGTAMPSFAGLPADVRQELAEQVERFRHDGARERIAEQLHDSEETIDETELQRLVVTLITPGEVAPAPAIGPADPQAVSRG
jgi:mono/diheme cytochrome c family protein